MEEVVAVMLVGWVGAHCGVRARGGLGWLLLWCGSILVVMWPAGSPLCLS